MHETFLHKRDQEHIWLSDPDRMKEVIRIWQWLCSTKNGWQIIRISGGSKNSFKEISENIVVFLKEIKPEIKKLSNLTVIEICSGSTALVALSSVLWGNNVYGIAVDKEKPSKRLREILKSGLGKRFKYIQGDILEDTNRVISEIKSAIPHMDNIIVVGVHCCKLLSPATIDIAHKMDAYKVVLVPCCVDREWAEDFLKRKFAQYSDWIVALSQYMKFRGYKPKIYRAKEMPTNANYLIVGLKSSSRDIHKNNFNNFMV